MKDCKQCGGSGVAFVDHRTGYLDPYLCPCVTEKMAKLEKVVEAARHVGMNWKLGAPYGFDALCTALAALEET